MSLVLRLLVLSILPILVATSLSQAGAAEERIGLVLSGGGARGVAHVGVIKVLEEMQIPVHAIAGTSMGALVGGLYASGMTAQDLEEVVSNIDWEEAFLDEPDRENMPVRRKQDDYDYPVKLTFSLKGGKLRFPLGAIQGQRAIMLIKNLMVKAESIRDFDQLPIPYRAVAADIETGEAYIFAEGDIVRAMRASMSLPAIFEPVEVEGRLLVDGGIANNLPVDVARRMGVDRLIVVNLGTPMSTRENLNSILSITSQMVTMLIWKNTEEQLANIEPDDLLITPDLEGVSTLDFEKFEMAFERGYEAASRMRSSLATFSVDDESWAQYLAGRELPLPAEPRIAFIEIQNNSKISDEIIRARLHQEIGAPLDREQLHEDISDVYGLGYFQSVDYEVVERDGTTGIAFEAREKSWGTDNLKLGLNLINDLDGDSRFNLGVSYRQKGVNKLAAEWFMRAQIGDTILLDGEFYQPLDYKSRFFISPFIGYRDYDVFILNPLVDSVTPIGNWRVRRATAEVDVGMNFFWNSQLRTGVFHSYGDNRIDRGGFDFDSSDFHEGGGTLSYVYDNLNSPYFPTHGGFLLAEYEANRTWLGSDEDFDRWQIRAQGAYSFGKTAAHTTIFTARTQQSVDALMQPQNFYQLGGLFNLSGLSQGVLGGRQVLFGSVQYQYRLSHQSLIPLSMPIYVGASIEAGNTWGEQDEISVSDLIASGSVYLAVDFPLGPIYVAYGRTDQNNQAVYLAFGWPFYRQDNVRR